MLDKLKFEITWRLLWAVSTGIACTVRYKVVGDKEMQELSRKTGIVLVLWHGATVLGIYHCRRRGYWTLISTSRDGELQNRLVQSRGFKTIRGSSNRSGIKALLEAIRKLKQGEAFALTPDGPKGPPKVVQSGTVFLARKSGSPVIPIGVACDRAKRLRSWDSHMIPMPFSRACIYFGEPVYLSQDESVSDEELAKLVGDAIDAADAEAERIMTGGRN